MTVLSYFLGFRVRKRPKLGSFRGNLVEFWVSKCSFSGWDTVSQLSCLRLSEPNFALGNVELSCINCIRISVFNLRLTRLGYFNKDPSIFKSVLLSGPPGIGKTTTATLVCKELGMSYVEMNASSTRSKNNLQDKVSQLLSNYSLLTNSGSVNDKHVLIMDEVDGMAGNEDRGGVQVSFIAH